jgi:hypothetical protein
VLIKILTAPVRLSFFPLYFKDFVYFLLLPPPRDQPTVLCCCTWQPTSELKQYAGTAALQWGALSVSHLTYNQSDFRQFSCNFRRVVGTFGSVGRFVGTLGRIFRSVVGILFCFDRVHMYSRCSIIASLGRYSIAFLVNVLVFLFFPFFVLQRAFFYFPCTVSGCDDGNRTRNIAVYTHWATAVLVFLSKTKGLIYILNCLVKKFVEDIWWLKWDEKWITYWSISIMLFIVRTYLS